MANNVLQGYVTRIYYRQYSQSPEGQVTAKPEKTEFGLDEVEYVGPLISSTGTSFTHEKRL